MITADTILRTAAKELGYDRFADPAEGTKYGRWYAAQVKAAYFAANGVPYCAMFVSWVFSAIGGSIFGDGRVYAYCPFIERDARAKGRLRSFEEIQPGDVLLFDWNDDGLADHVGFAARRVGDYVHTIEGNTSDSSDDNGGKVLRRVRHRSGIRCVVRPVNLSETSHTTGKIAEDGVIGTHTITALQARFGTPRDGVISSQYAPNAEFVPAAGIGWEWVDAPEGSSVVAAVQRWLGIDADGIWGFQTSKALQTRLKVTDDGYFGSQSAKALQKALNGGGLR